MELSDEAKAAHAAYMRDYRKKHPEKQREYYRRRWEKAAKEAAEPKDQESQLGRDQQ